MGEALVTVTQSNFESEVLKSSATVLVDFWAEWCAPCRALAPVLDGLAQEQGGRVKIGKVNVDEHPELAAKFGILNIPTLIFFKGGQEVDRAVGVQSKAQLQEKIDKLAG
ncbi:MAG: thioredoxin [Candidatus Omnitrophica bacterium CG11_big_fil_rev_8_21_14_0_20_64_10]|nr:MAG: thioredoxin [Candidatus Omnitrophica bacterium CG11_big_fil_rev_8_21_14_0_20_64_10]